MSTWLIAIPFFFLALVVLALVVGKWAREETVLSLIVHCWSLGVSSCILILRAIVTDFSLVVRCTGFKASTSWFDSVTPPLGAWPWTPRFDSGCLALI